MGKTAAAVIRVRGSRQQMPRAHRVAYELAHGPIPEGLVVRHRCDQPGCINPTHLEVGTITDNNRDRARRGRSAVGDRSGARVKPWRWRRAETHTSSKLCWEFVASIREGSFAGMSDAEIGRRLGVSSSAVRNVRIGRTWKSA